MTSFTRRVLTVVRSIPPGRVATYGDVAAMAGRPRAARAVGTVMRTCGDPAVPCHRVIAAGGLLGGFGRNPHVKRQLLLAEGVDALRAARAPLRPAPLEPGSPRGGVAGSDGERRGPGRTGAACRAYPTGYPAAARQRRPGPLPSNPMSDEGRSAGRRSRGPMPGRRPERLRGAVSPACRRVCTIWRIGWSAGRKRRTIWCRRCS